MLFWTIQPGLRQSIYSTSDIGGANPTAICTRRLGGENCLAAAKELGGIVVGVSNLIMPGTPAENITALLETIEKNR